MMKTEPRDEPVLSNATFHPDFESDDGNIILVAKDTRVHFRIHTYSLSKASGFFQTMFSLPQASTSTPEPIYVEEDERVLEHLLRMITGLPILEIKDHSLLRSLLHTTEKYDMPGPLSLLRLYVMTPSPLDSDPILLYGCARRYGWESEAKHFSTRTLRLNLRDASHRESLLTLSTEALLDLMTLHWTRRDKLREALSTTPFVSSDTSRCMQCDSHISYSTWKELKSRIWLEMDQRPLGDKVVDPGLTTWPEAIAAWKATCPKEECKRLLYDRAETLRVIRDCIDGLPKTT